MHPKSFVLFIACLLFAGPALAQKAPQGSTQTYNIVGGQSDIHVRVYKAGALGALRHNHVVSIGGLSGKVHLGASPAQSRFAFNVAVKKLIVDNAALRRRSGKQFSSKPSASDVAGTRKNMLSSKLLNGARFPTIKIKGKGGPKAGKKSGTLKVSVKILGRTKDINLPISLSIKGNTLTASGSKRISHGQLGLRPFSALFGALKVADRLDLKYRVVAKRAN